MVRSIPPRTMRNIWNEEKKRAGSNPFGSIPPRSTMRDWYDKENIRQKYSDQINSNKTSGTSGALYKKGRLKSRSVQGQPRNIYRAGGYQGTIYSKKESSKIPKSTMNLANFKLDEMIEEIETKIFETDENLSIIIASCLEKAINVFYDATKEEVVVHADKDYKIPLKLKRVNIKTLEWSYNNGVIEIVFQK